MADDVDLACDLEQIFTEQAIAANRKTLVKFAFTGECRNCSNPVESPKIFCDSECSAEYEWYAKRSRGAEVFSGAS